MLTCLMILVIVGSNSNIVKQMEQEQKHFKSSVVSIVKMYTYLRSNKKIRILGNSTNVSSIKNLHHE